MTNRRLVRFGGFTFDADSRELWRDDHRVHLQDHPARVLGLLVARPGEVVTREELVACLWPGTTFIDTEVGLNTAIRKLRIALQDDSDAPRYVETLPRRGYRLLARVESVEEPVGTAMSTVAGLGTVDRVDLAAAETPSAITDKARRLRGLVFGSGVLAGVALLASLGTGWPWRANGEGEAFAIDTIAVLPLDNLSPDPEHDYFAAAMGEALITRLAGVRSLRVISRTSTLRFKQTERPIPEVARDLGADALIEGSVFRAAGRVRINVQLVSHDDRHLWAQSYEGTLDDILGLQHRIADDVASQVAAELGVLPDGERRVNVAAYDEYLLGRFNLQTTSPEGLDQALGHFRRSIELDPGFAPAHAGLAETWVVLGNFALVPIAESRTRAKEAALEALRLDPALAVAHGTMGFILADWEWRWTEAEREIRLAIRLDPSEPGTYNRLAWLLLLRGEVEEGIAQARLSVEVDPQSPMSHTGVCRTLVAVGRMEESIPHCRRAIEIDPEHLPASSNLQDALWGLGRFKEYGEEWQRQNRLIGEEERARLIAQAYEEGGAEGLVEFTHRDAVEGCGEDPTPRIACIASLSEVEGMDAAFAALGRAFDNRSGGISGVVFYPEFVGMRSDPRFAGFRERLQLPATAWPAEGVPKADTGGPAQRP